MINLRMYGEFNLSSWITKGIMVLEKQDSGISDSGISLSTDGGTGSKSPDTMSLSPEGTENGFSFNEPDEEFDHLHYSSNHKAIECALCR